MALPIEVMSVGTWNGFEFTMDHLKEMAENFQKLKEVIKPPIKLGHSKDETGKPALGWINELKLQGNKLMAYATDVPELLMDAIKKKFYRRVSSEVLFEYSYNGKKYGRVFSGLALLGAEAPAVKNLEDLQAYLTGKGEFESVQFFTINEKGDDEMSSDLEKKLAELSEQVSTFAATNAELKTENEKLKKDLDEQKSKEVKFAQEASTKSLFEFCEAQVKEGKMLPAQRDILCGEKVKAVFTDDNSVTIPFDMFKAFAEKGGKVLDKESHANDDKHEKDDKKASFKDPQAEVERRVVEFMDKNADAKYADAINHVLDADEKLAHAYTFGYQATINDD